MAYNNFDNYYRDENGNVHRDIPLGTSPSDAFARTNKRLKDEIKKIEEQIKNTDTKISDEVKALTESIAENAQKAETRTEQSEKNFDEKLEKNNQRIDSEINEVNKTIKNTADEIHQQIRTSVDTVNSTINTEVNNINHRVDNIIANSTDTEGNSELIDIRTGTDGTVFETAGTAVRMQFIEDRDYLSSMENNLYGISVLKESLELFDENNYLDGYYINENGELKRNQVTGETYFIPVLPFYEVVVTTTRTWDFITVYYDKNKKFLSGEIQSKFIGSWKLSIPKDCCFIRCAFYKEDIEQFSIKAKLKISETINKHDEAIETLKLSKSNHDEAIETLKLNKGNIDLFDPDIYTQGYPSPTTGEIIYNQYVRTTDYIKISNVFDSYHIWCATTVDHIVCFYNKEKHFISSVVRNEVGDYKLIIPEQAFYLRVAYITARTKEYYVIGHIDSFRYKTFSILGDSYSTFYGFTTPITNKQWYPADSEYSEGKNNDVKSIEQTWWYLFAQETGCALQTNNSLSGSPVCYDGYGSGTSDAKTTCFATRAASVGTPELIIVEGGTNDSWNNSGLGDYVYSDWSDENMIYFRPALAYTLNYLKQHNMGAKIIFMLNSGLKAEINESVENICKHYQIPLLKLSANVTKQNAHPDANGMIAIKNELIEFLESV